MGAVREHLGDPKVEDLDGALAPFVPAARVAKKDVFGLDVAMDHADRVRRGEAIEHGLHDGERLLYGERPTAAELFMKGAAIEPFHHDKGIAIRRHADVGDLDDRGVVEPAQHLRFRKEPAAHGG